MEEMDGARFSKLCRDCRLLNRSFTAIDVDLIFAKTKKKVKAEYGKEAMLTRAIKRRYIDTCHSQKLISICTTGANIAGGLADKRNKHALCKSSFYKQPLMYFS